VICDQTKTVANGPKSYWSERIMVPEQQNFLNSIRTLQAITVFVGFEADLARLLYSKGIKFIKAGLKPIEFC